MPSPTLAATQPQCFGAAAARPGLQPARTSAAVNAVSSMAAPGSGTADLPSNSGAEQPAVSAAEATPAVGEAPAPTALMRKAGRNRGNIRKRPAADEDSHSTAVEAKRDDTSVMRPPKVPKAGAMAFTTRHTGEDQLRPFNFSSSRTLQQTTDQGATATLETETAFDRDARWVGICGATYDVVACRQCQLSFGMLEHVPAKVLLTS